MTHIATPQEFLDAFKALDDRSRAGLFAAARRYCVGNCGFQEAEDLVNELVFRVVDGKRNWDVEVPFMAFAILGFRSIANGERRSARRRLPHLSLDLCADDPDVRLHFEANPHASAEEALAAAQDRAAGRSALDFARRSLIDDPLALQVLQGIEDDMTSSEMRAEFGVGKEVLHAARGRVNARLSIWAERRARRELGNMAAHRGRGNNDNNNRSGRTQ